jgi:hypothetical protein
VQRIEYTCWTAAPAKRLSRVAAPLVLLLITAGCGGGGGSNGGGGGGGSSAVTVGGTITGLTGSGLVLADNGANNLPVSSNVSFVFSATIGAGTAYRVTIVSQPAGQSCSVANGNGQAVSSNVTTVAVTCAAAVAGYAVYPLGATDVAWEPHQRGLYVTLGTGAPSNANAVAVVDPASGRITRSAATVTNPTIARVCDDGQFLYVGSRGNNNVQRFALPALTPDLTISLGADPNFGPYGKSSASSWTGRKRRFSSHSSVTPPAMPSGAAHARPRRRGRH